MPWIPPPLKTERLHLVAPDEEVPPRFVWEGRTAVEQNLPGLPSNWKIFLKETDQPIGTLGFIQWDRESQVGEIGFILMNVYTGRGYMTEACRAVLSFGFEGMRLKKIEAKSLPNNGASIRVLEKIGMTKERRVQARLFTKGPLVDLDLFSILRPLSPS